MDEPPAEAAAELREALLEILRQLNRIEMEATGVSGLEPGEIHHLLARGGFPELTPPAVATALGVLVGNGFARAQTDPEYAWDRGRVLGTRYTITTEGKEFLVEQLARVNRVD
jgi:hypothetical protein